LSSPSPVTCEKINNYTYTTEVYKKIKIDNREEKKYYLVQFLIELSKLGTLSHDILSHEKWGLHGTVAPGHQKWKPIIYECLIQENSIALQIISSAPSHISTLKKQYKF
jgi:hypothetical protein